MIKPFLNDDFLLQSKTAQQLYHGFAKDLPIIDYHNYLSVADIAADRQFENLTQIWLKNDEHKWRMMRINGVDEIYCAGGGNDIDKFKQWAATVPYMMPNSSYRWTHLELKRYFGIETLLSSISASTIYKKCNELLNTPDFSARNLLRKMNVETICISNDLTDGLSPFATIQKSNFEVKVLPTLRADKIFAIEHGTNFRNYINKLSNITGIQIRTLADCLKALHLRVEAFDKLGCRLADHVLPIMYAEDFTYKEVNLIFEYARKGQYVADDSAKKFKSAMLFFLSEMYHSKNWTQQFHLGMVRNTNTKMMQALGVDKGFDAVGDYAQAKPLIAFLDKMEKDDKLAKTILYNVNPKDNALFATIIGNFHDTKTPEKIQLGAASSFANHKDGIEQQLKTLSNMGLLSRSIGISTNAHSLLSFSRHEYFRRILCNKIGNHIEQGLLPNDIAYLGLMIRNICYHNAKNYFGI